jgi:hypothetical protein
MLPETKYCTLFYHNSYAFYTHDLSSCCLKLRREQRGKVRREMKGEKSKKNREKKRPERRE